MSALKPILTILLTSSLLHAQTDEQSAETLPEELLQDTPNVVLIIANNFGSSILNKENAELFKTPNLDALVATSSRWENFYVSPVGSLTRASLFTGRYNIRTKVLGSAHGVSVIADDEMTLAEVLSGSGYSTGLFGTWGLGDHYPSRATDQGFDKVLTHRGAGLGLASDIITEKGQENSLILLKNNYEELVAGNANDLFFDAAETFIKKAKNHESAFFVTIATNNYDPSLIGSPDVAGGYSSANLSDSIQNLDRNLGELTALLKAQELANNTIVIILGDNGPISSTNSYNKLKGSKGSVYEGGVRTPLLISWPDKIKQGSTVTNNVAAHIDIMPTILDACGYGVEEAFGFDGRSLLTQIESSETKLAERAFVQQSHKGQKPSKGHHFMVRKGNWKLINPSDPKAYSASSKTYELYDVVVDPAETKNLAADNKDKVTELLSDYNNWFNDVTESRLRDSAPSYILVDRAEENPLVLTWQDRLAKDWGYEHPGFWKLSFEHKGRCDVRVEFPANFKEDLSGWTAELTLGKKSYSQVLHSGEHHYVFPGIEFTKGRHHLRSTFKSPDGLKSISGYQVRLQHR